MVEAIVALGSNLGNRESNLKRALAGVARRRTTRVTEVSPVYETEPMYYENQGWFLNCVAAVETRLRPLELLDSLKAIEEEMGRQPAVRYGPRTIDLDILFYGNEIVSEPGLEIPHPRLTERLFVLMPLNDIRPGLIHPVLGKRVSELLAGAGTGKRVIRKPGLLADLGPSLSPRRS